MQILTQNDKTYPKRLRETYRPPKKLFAIGNTQILNEAQIAIVGTRHPTPIGAENARHFAYELSKAGLIITSGLALGVDGAAHQGALDAKAPTIAVLANGLDQIYPSRHKPLADAIIRNGGAILSEWPPKTAPLPAYFPQRNRIISGMGIGTLVVEAQLKSGSLITARLALEQNREVFAIPGSIHNPQAKGCHHLINQGAKLVTEPNEILLELNMMQVQHTLIPKNKNHEEKQTLDPKHKLLLECVDFSPTTMEYIIQRSGLSSNEVSAILLTLEIKGYIKKSMGGYFRAKS